MNRPRRLELLLVVLVVVSGAYFARAEFIPTWADRHVAVASERYDIDFGSPPEWFSGWSVGDGQAFAVIAVDPSGGQLGMKVKEPAYRFSRAGYGWLAAAVSLGNPRWVPYGLALVGAAGVVANLLLAVWLRSRVGPGSWLLVLNPAIFLGFAGDTAEPIGAALLGFALATGSIWASLALGVTRPSYLVGLWGHWSRFTAGLVATGILALYSLLRFGWDQFLPYGGRLDLPLFAYFRNPSVAGWLLAALAMATLVLGAKHKSSSWMLGALFVLCLGDDVLLHPANAWRASGFLPVLWAFGPAATTPPPAPRVREETQLTPVDADVG